MSKKNKLLSEQLREAILNAEISRYRIAKETGLTEAALSRFVNGVSNLSLASIDLIGECLGLKLESEGKPKKKSTKRKPKGD